MKSQWICRIGFALATVLVTVAARADLTMTAKMGMDMSKMTINGERITPDELARIKNMPMFGGSDMTMISYYSGNKYMVVTPMSTMITDTDAKTMTMLMPTLKKYMVTSLNSEFVNKYTSESVANVVDMKATKTFLGHEAHLYKMYLKNSYMTMEGYAWIAPDLPAIPSSTNSNPMLEMLKTKLAGQPMKATYEMTMSTMGKIGASFEVTAISTDTIPASQFTIPSGYTQMQAPSNLGATPAPAK